MTTKVVGGNGAVLKEETEIEQKKYVHMDMGQGSDRNGYYLSDLFKTGYDDIEYDNPDQDGDYRFNYTGYVRIIRY